MSAAASASYNLLVEFDEPWLAVVVEDEHRLDHDVWEIGKKAAAAAAAAL